MNYLLIFKLIGNMLKIEGLFLLVPLSVAIIHREDDIFAFVLTIFIIAAACVPLSFIKPKEKIFRTKDAFAAAALSWIFFSLFGALPFYLSRYFESFVDCFFESVAGFTTTGMTILTDVENIPHGILFWRSFSHWIGGMGVLVFMLAAMPSMNASSVNLLKAESTGPSPNKIVPRIRETAKVMYLIYLGMSVLLAILLILAGLPIYDALTQTFSIAGTGGFSNLNQNAGAFNNITAEIIMSVFMFLFGASFSLYFYLLKGNIRQVLNDEELRLYFGIVIVSIAAIAIDITPFYGSVPSALRRSSFQVTSVISTTGFTTDDFSHWPALSRIILTVLMLTGCCAGSTGGGIKLIRFLLLFKTVGNELNKIIHPRSVKTITINGKKIDNDVIQKAALFFFIYFIVLISATIIVSLDSDDLGTNITAVISTLSNSGPGWGKVGPTGNFAHFSPVSKVVFIFCMLAGRLEFFPLLILFNPTLWKKQGI